MIYSVIPAKAGIQSVALLLRTRLKAWIPAFAGMTTLAFVPACQRRDVPNKIIDGPPVHSAEVVVPAHAAQEFFLLMQDAMRVIVPVVNRLAVPNATFPELTGPDAQSQYTFQTNENHYKTAILAIQFRDSSNNVIDPITTRSSTSTTHHVLIAGNGSSNLFSYALNITLTLTTAGDVGGKKQLTGTSSFSGSSYSITFTLVSPGPSCTFEGLIDGALSASGTGGPASQTTTAVLVFSADHKADGSISWEGQEGGLHLETNGDGFIVTNQYRLLID